MQAIWYGALGALLVLGSAALGFFMGRRGSRPPQTAPERASESVDEGQRQALQEQQRAFERMLSYNAEVAYGMAEGLPGEEGL